MCVSRWVLLRINVAITFGCSIFGWVCMELSIITILIWVQKRFVNLKIRNTRAWSTQDRFSHLVHPNIISEQFGFNWSSQLQESNERKPPLLHKNLWAFRCKRLQVWSILFLVRNYLFLKSYLTSERQPFLTMFYTINSSQLLLVIPSKVFR